MKPRREVVKAFSELRELWKPPEEDEKNRPGVGETGGRGDKQEDQDFSNGNCSTTHDEDGAGAEDKVHLARQRFTIAKRRFLDTSKAAIAGRADPGAVPAALRDVDRARAELREAERDRAAMRRARSC